MKIKLLLSIPFIVLSLKGMQPSDISLYFYFGSNPTISTDDIKTIYETMAPVYNPANYEQSPVKALMHKEQAAEYFSKMSEAYEILRDQTLRPMYDIFGLSRVRDFLNRKKDLLDGIKKGTEALNGFITYCHMPQYREQIKPYHEKLCVYWIQQLNDWLNTDVVPELQRAVVTTTYNVIQFLHSNNQVQNSAEIIKYIDLALNYVRELLPLNDAQDSIIAQELTQLRNQYQSTQSSGSGSGCQENIEAGTIGTKRPFVSIDDKHRVNNAVKRLRESSNELRNEREAAYRRAKEIEKEVEQIRKYVEEKSYFTTDGTNGLTVEEFYTEITKRLTFMRDFPEGMSQYIRSKCDKLFSGLIIQVVDLLRDQFHLFKSDAQNQDNAYTLGAALYHFGKDQVTYDSYEFHDLRRALYSFNYNYSQQARRSLGEQIEKLDKALKDKEKSALELAKILINRCKYVHTLAPHYQNKALKQFYKIAKRMLDENESEYSVLVAKQLMYMAAAKLKWVDCSQNITLSGIYRKFKKINSLFEKSFIPDMREMREFCNAMKEKLNTDDAESITTVKQTIISSSVKFKKLTNIFSSNLKIQRGLHTLRGYMGPSERAQSQTPFTTFIALLSNCVQKLIKSDQQNDALELIENILKYPVLQYSISQPTKEQFLDLKKQIMGEKKNEN